MYFVTICTHLRRYILGEVADSQMSLNEAGRLVEQSLLGLQSRFPSLRIDSHVIMPNHAHALLEIRAPSSEDQSSTLGSIVRQWKAASCHLIRRAVDPSFGWQRNYYERIVRSYEEMEKVRLYIAQNPVRWDEDTENSETAPHPVWGVIYHAPPVRVASPVMPWETRGGHRIAGA